ncbi:MAG: peptidylprolyl isomerase [Candidatus Zixiibacteriota bacterium]|nr:MAG: peptidylprolyl isomerase [candidate division Zixibacteria bacterium]
MRKIAFLLLVAVSLAAVMSCSKKEETARDETENVADSTPANLSDSLAAIRHPVRSDDNPFVTLVTDYGNMTLELYRDVAPTHVDSFLARAAEGFYDNTTFHRIIPQFMVQGGDPLGNGSGGAGYYLKAELSDLPHREGTLAMARGRDPNSASSQFYICLARNAVTRSLDGKYTVFGHLIRGYDVLHKMTLVECVVNPFDPTEISRPKEPVYLRTVYTSDAEGNEIL